MDYSKECKKYLEKLGQSVTVIDGENVIELHAVIIQTWRKNKSRFEDTVTEIGRSRKEYYQYIGPVDVDICALSDDARLECDGIKYVFLKKERVKAGDRVQFYTGMMKRVYEEASDESL